jgi:hypothetical protein
VLPLCAEPAVILTVGDRSEHRVRFQDGSNPATDLANVPTVAVGLHAHRYDAWFATYPMFAIHDFQSDEFRGALAMAQGSTGLAARSRRLQFVVSESASYGLQNFAYLLPLNLPPGQVAPPTSPVPTTNGDFLFATSQSMMSLNYRWTRHVSTFVSPTLTVGGGIDNKERPELSPTQYIPFQVMPKIDARFDVQASRTMLFETLGSAFTSAFDDRRCDYLTGGAPSPFTSQRNSFGICKSEGQEAEMAENLRMRWSKTTDVALGAGGSIVRTRIDAVSFTGGPLPSPIPDRTRFFPVLTARFSHRFSWFRPEVSRVELDARLGPMMDIRFGWIDPRLNIALRDISYYKLTQLKATIDFGQTVPPDEPISTTYVQGELEALYALGRRFSVGGGIRGAWQRQTVPNNEAYTFFTGIVYGAFVYHEPPIFLVGGRNTSERRAPRPEL